MKVLIVIDAQNDFCGADGALTSKIAQSVVPNIATYIRENANPDTVLIFTKDTHDENYLDTQEGKRLPVPHCVKDTHGWELVPEVLEALYDTRDKYNELDTFFPYITDHIIEKPTFGSISLMNLLYVLDDDYGVDEITLMGIDTSICIISNVLMVKAGFPEVPIRVVADCCASMTEETHNRALEVMKICHIDVV